MSCSNLFSKVIVSALAGILLSATAASATIYDVVVVQTGSNGFGASGFHDSSGSNVMSGPDLATITTGPISPFGTFNDITGVLSVTLPVDNGGPTFTLSPTGNNLQFGPGIGGFGFLSSAATLDIVFDNPTGALSPTTIGFLAGQPCCQSSTTGPNSFLAATGDDLANGLDAIMTLWGANGFNLSKGKYKNSELGMDLRLGLTVVPLPAALPLFGTGLAFMGFMGWRRKRKIAAA